MSIGKVSRIIDKNNTKADIVDLDGLTIPIYLATKTNYSSEVSNISIEEWMENTAEKQYNILPGGLYNYLIEYYNKRKSLPRIKITQNTYGYSEEEPEPYFTGSYSYIATVSFINTIDEGIVFFIDLKDTYFDADASYDEEDPSKLISVGTNSASTNTTITLKKINNEEKESQTRVEYIVSGAVINYDVTYNEEEEATFSINSIVPERNAIQLKHRFVEGEEPPTTHGGIYFDSTIMLPPIPSDTEEE